MNYIYILKQKENGWCKVGKTTTPTERISTLEKTWGKFDNDSIIYQMNDTLEQSLDNIESTIHRSLTRKYLKISMIGKDIGNDGYIEFFRLDTLVEEVIDYLYGDWIVSKKNLNNHIESLNDMSVVLFKENKSEYINERVVLKIEEIKYLSNNNLTTFDIKFLTYLKSKILEPQLKTIEVDTKDIFDLGVNQKHFNELMNVTLDRLKNKFLLEINGVFYPILEEYSFEKYSKKIIVSFNSEVIKIFSEISKIYLGGFEIPTYKNKYSIILHKYITLNKEEEFTIRLSDYKELLGIPKSSYKNSFELDRKVTKKIVSDINQNSKINLDYMKIKNSREVTRIKFFVN